MKRSIFSLLLIAASAALPFPFSALAQDPVEDKIELSREGGTTRIASTTYSLYSLQTVAVVPEVEAYNYRNVVAIYVQNYRGSALVEITGSKGAKQTFFEVYDMGFDVVSLSGLPAGEYTIRITLGTEVFSGTFNKGKNGRR